MKLMSFHLMPYRDLPADFWQRYASVCVDVDPALIDPRQVHTMYNDYMDELELAASLGFDAVCVNEHHNSAYGMMPSPNLIASALARRTTDAALCILGTSLTMYNPPTRVAEEMAMIDCISGGRLIAGFPVGTPMDSAFSFGQNPSTLRARYNEAHDLITRAWRAEKPFAFNGRFYKYRYVNPVPRPLQKPNPPIWIPAGGSIETWRWCAEMDYVYCYTSYYGHKAALETIRGFWSEMDRLGKDRNPYRVGFLQMVGVAETSLEAERLYKEPAEFFYRNCLHIDSRFVGPPGYATEATIRAKSKSQLEKVARSKGALGIGGVAREWDGIRRNGYVVAGDPDQVAASIRELATELNVGHLMVLLQFGNMNHELANYNIRLFAEKVLPQVRDLFGGWEDRWWPRPVARRWSEANDA